MPLHFPAAEHAVPEGAAERLHPPLVYCCSRLDPQGRSALQLAAKHAHWELLELLLADERTRVPGNLLQVAIAGVRGGTAGGYAPRHRSLSGRTAEVLRHMCADGPTM